MRSRVKLKFPIYVPRGGQDHGLHGKHPVLSWVSRCDIVGDVAAGLQYVHNIKATCCQKKNRGQQYAAGAGRVLPRVARPRPDTRVNII